MTTVLDKYLAAYRRIPSPRNRARLAWNLCKYTGAIRNLSDADQTFLRVHEFI